MLADELQCRFGRLPCLRSVKEEVSKNPELVLALWARQNRRAASLD
jgi:hypothetical protein